jgi:hypothetical protein
MMNNTIYECGICDCYHPWSWDGDCRDDVNRFGSPEEYAETKGITASDVTVKDWTARQIADGGWMYQAGAYCLELGLKRHTFTQAQCEEYCFGEGDQPDTCPLCGSRIMPND